WRKRAALRERRYQPYLRRMRTVALEPSELLEHLAAQFRIEFRLAQEALGRREGFRARLAAEERGEPVVDEEDLPLALELRQLAEGGGHPGGGPPPRAA